MPITVPSAVRCMRQDYQHNTIIVVQCYYIWLWLVKIRDRDSYKLLKNPAEYDWRLKWTSILYSQENKKILLKKFAAIA